MIVIPYRNKDGKLYAPEYKPRFVDDAKKSSGMYCAAKFIFCPESDGLKWIGNCEKCELFRGHKRYVGIKCKSKKPYNPLPCYEKTMVYRTKKYDQNGTRENKAAKNN